MILLLLLNLSISSLFGLPATFGNPPSDPACDALRTVADSLTGARIYGSLCADSIPKTECTTASLEVLKKCIDGIHVDQDCLDRMHTNLTEVSMDDQDCFCGGLVKFSEVLTSVKALLCIEEDEVRAGMGSLFWPGTKTKPSFTTQSSTSSSSTSTSKKSRSATGDLESVPYETANYEKRLYPSAKYVCTTSTYENLEARGGKSTMVKKGEKMFYKLFAYIEGRNNKNQKIEMTSPVITKMSVEDDSDYMGHQVTKTMCFFIPKKFQGNPPAPNDQDVFILENPEMSVFVKTFMGYGSDVTDAVWIKEKESLMREMQDMGVENRVSNNHFYTATYDIGLSKHEVMLEIITREKKSNYDDDNYAIDDQTGLVTSPNWGKGNYPVNLDKVYPIKVAAGSIIEILFTDFMLEGRHSSSCIFDWVKVVDGDGTELLGKTCGTNKPAAAIKSNTNEAKIEFHSDVYFTDKGFRAVWNACTGAGGNCNSAGSGEVKSPGYPNTYGNSLRVSMPIEVASGSKIELTFVDIDIEEDASCRYDYVQVFDTDNTELLKKCGTGLPEKIVSKGNKLTVKFMTDFSVIAKGFRATWREVTSSVTLGNSEGSIKSPDFPNNYPNNKDKEWDLSAAPGGSRIQLTFNSFDLEDDASCSYDYVQISYGTFSKKYCGASKPDPVTSTGNTMNVKFHSDGSVVKKGFSAVWKDYVQDNSREKPEKIVVISSIRGAAQHQGGMLGQYEYDEQQQYYRQTSTEQGHEKFTAIYLYSDAGNEWWVHDTPGEKEGWLYNPTPSKSLPTSGWQYYDGKSWQEDPTLTISPGPLSLARQFTVTATGAAAEKQPGKLGVFTRTGRWWLGRPVYTNTQGRLLHHGHAGWVIGDTLGRRGLTGSRAHHSPVSEDSWRYWTGSEWKPASVTVTASD